MSRVPRNGAGCFLHQGRPNISSFVRLRRLLSRDWEVLDHRLVWGGRRERETRRSRGGGHGPLHVAMSTCSLAPGPPASRPRDPGSRGGTSPRAPVSVFRGHGWLAEP